MKKTELFTLYEKLYFHEIEMREKLSGRLQLPLAILVSVIGVLAFMLRNFSNSGETALLVVFMIFYGMSFIGILLGITNFIRSWYGYEYSFLPSAKETEDYRQLLIETYESYQGSDDLVEKHFTDYLMRYYVECSSVNTNNNDQRSIFLHLTNKYIVLGATFAFISFIPFYFGNFDKNLKESVQSVKISEPIEIKGAIMTKEQKNQGEKPPSPPPPPPKRVIREGVEIKSPPPSTEQ